MNVSHRGKRVAAGLVGIAVLLPLSGCGGRGSVEGSLSVAGRPVTKGALLTFIGSSGETAQAQVREDGSFTAEKVSTGQVRVLVVNAPLPPANQPPTLPKSPKDVALLKPHIETGNQVPKRYGDPDKGVTIHVQRGKNRIDINLDP